MHLAVFPEQRSVGVENNGRVVVKPGRAAFKERSDDDDFQFARQFGERFGRRPGNRLGQVKQICVFFAAKILRAKQFLQADDLRPARRRFANAGFRLGKILPRIERAAHLNQAYGEFFRHA